MTQFKTALITVAVLALPFAATAQIPTDGLTDKVKAKAADTIIENATKEDAITGAAVIFKGGSKEDAAIAIVKNRAEKKIEGIVDDQIEGVSTGEAPSSAKVYDAAKGSSTTYQDKAPDAGSATTYPSQPSISAPVVSQTPVNCPAGTTAQTDGTCMITGNWGG